jgi:hypothetical protein
VIGQTYSSTGLEVINPTRLPILIESLSTDAGKIGLTWDMVRTKCSQRFKHIGIELVDTVGCMTNLYINCNVVGDAYNINLWFIRDVSFTVGAKTFTRSSCATWDIGTTGIHKGKADNIINNLNLLLDAFIVDYVKANPSVVKK